MVKKSAINYRERSNRQMKPTWRSISKHLFISQFIFVCRPNIVGGFTFILVLILNQSAIEILLVWSISIHLINEIARYLPIQLKIDGNLSDLNDFHHEIRMERSDIYLISTCIKNRTKNANTKSIENQT